MRQGTRAGWDGSTPRKIAALAVGLSLLAAGVQAAQVRVPLARLTAAQQKALGVRTSPLRSARMRPLASLPATFTPPPNGRAAVSAPFAGTVERVAVVEGQPVTGGQVLATVFSREALTASADAAQASAEAMVAAQAQRRTSLLVTEGIVAGARGEEAQARLTSARALLAAKSLSVRAASADLHGRYLLRAPLSGRVAHVGVQAGQGLDAMALAFLVDRTDRIQVMADLPATLAGRIQVGDQAVVEGAVGRVVSVGSAIDPKTRSIPLLAEIPPRPAFIPGRLTRVELSDRQEAGVQTVDRSAVIRVGGKDVVLVQKAKGFAPTPVKVIGYAGDQVSLRTGLADGSQVAVSGLSEMKSLLEQ